MLNNTVSALFSLSTFKENKEPKTFWKENNSLLRYVLITNYPVRIYLSILLSMSNSTKNAFLSLYRK
jgi:hypothetical protein